MFHIERRIRKFADLHRKGSDIMIDTYGDRFIKKMVHIERSIRNLADL